jgi:DNA polymerase
MPSDYNHLLDATIQHIEDLKSRGVKNIAVSKETLRALAQSPPAKSQILNLQPQIQFAAPVAKTQATISMPAPVATPKSEITSSLPEKAAAFTALRERALSCVKCPHLASSRKNVVFGGGNIDAQLPFVGAAGQLLTKIISATGLSRADVYIANILKCRPDTPGQLSGNRKPTAEEMKTCLPYLHEQIDLIRPKVIVALGATAVEGLLGKTVGITKLRGNWQTYRGTPLMPTYHPAYLLRNQAMSEKRRVWEDMLAVMEKLEMPASEKQRNYFLK